MSLHQPIDVRPSVPTIPSQSHMQDANRPLRWRRLAFAGLVTSTISCLIALMVITLSTGGYDAYDLALTMLFAITLPWTVIGFWNAFIGLAIMRLSKDPARAVCPVDEPAANAPLTSSTALAVCIRNEDVYAVAQNLECMLASLTHAGAAPNISAYVLSDTNQADIAAEEETTFAAIRQRWAGKIDVTYRRRDKNTAFKAGNIRDFLERWGGRHDFMLTLDADSFMSADAIVRLIRVMEANPRLGILQSLVAGMPAASAFARVFQFGMRLGMRSYTIGSAWWQGDCGPYWGHNALIRIKPFMEHCHLPTIGGQSALSGPILSHDQVEATFMRRGGYEVRVLPEETGSWEENPPSLVEFVRRDLRWCLGNMQYLHLLFEPGLKPVSRFQLALAILMFVGSPAWLGFIVLSTVGIGLSQTPLQTFDVQFGTALFFTIMTMVFAPKIATVIDILARPAARRSFGGAGNVFLSVIGEVVFFTLLAPIMAVAHTKFLAGLPFGHKPTWAAQTRSAHLVTLRQAIVRFWPQALFGIAMFSWIATLATAPFYTFFPFTLGPLLVIPFAMITSWDAVGRALAWTGLWRIPEETSPPAALTALDLPVAIPHPPVFDEADAKTAPLPALSPAE